MSRGPRRGVALLCLGTVQSHWLQAVAPGELTWHQHPLAASWEALEKTRLLTSR